MAREIQLSLIAATTFLYGEKLRTQINYKTLLANCQCAIKLIKLHEVPQLANCQATITDSPSVARFISKFRNLNSNPILGSANS